jgi:hypothetical protein
MAIKLTENSAYSRLGSSKCSSLVPANTLFVYVCVSACARVECSVCLENKHNIPNVN